MTNEKLKILCFGAGAIGSYIGGSLAVHGHEVHFLDRPETINMIRQNGIKLILPEGIHTIEPEFLWDSLEAAISEKKFDFSIVAVKSFDTDSLLNSWKNVLAHIPPVLCLQNGVENEEKIRNLIGKENTISGTVTTAIGRIENGIMVEKLRGLGIENKNELTEKIINTFNSAGLKAIAYQNPESMQKLFPRIAGISLYQSSSASRSISSRSY
jgi:2-dehydropantoate 2-reductase